MQPIKDNPVRVLLVEDDPFAATQLRMLIQDKHPTFRILATCQNGLEGLQAIHQLKPELVLTDVEMPELNGLEMLKRVENPDFEVIFITSFDKYAISALRLSALDYLLKPVKPDELENSLNHFLQRKREKKRNEGIIENFLHNMTIGENTAQQRLAIATSEGTHFIPLAELLRIEALSNYAKIIVRNSKPITVSKTLKDLEESLPADMFIRIHKSHLVNLLHIKNLLPDQRLSLTNGDVLEVARRRWPEVQQAMV
ncbi:MAG TPA: LytTR family DNA-binding domain-containing protein [Saprospiraceae bacterium]|nr:LytTR family DNA-binding domain-containing protein [Saprospiraceae bacterium]